MHYLGMDVAEARLDLSDPDGRIVQAFDNKTTGINRLVRCLQRHHPAGDVQLVIEPTSTYHHLLIHTLAQRGIPYTLVNPASTAYYARVQMKRSKTDQADAQTLARLGEREQLTPTPPADDARERLKSLMRHRDRLQKDARSWRNRLAAAARSPWATREELRSIRGIITRLEREKDKADSRVEALANDQPQLMEQVRLVTTVKGIGKQTALLILCEMPAVELHRSAKVWPAFCGVAPALHQSGQKHYSSLSRMGSARIRGALYMPALAAIRSNPALKAFAGRLKEKGKAGLTIIAAVMNKLLRICFGVMRSGRPFDPDYHERAVREGLKDGAESHSRPLASGQSQPASPARAAVPA